jgi:hypothetical protein
MSTYKYYVIPAYKDRTVNRIQDDLNNLPDGYRPTVGTGSFIICEKLEWDQADLVVDPEAKPEFGVPMKVN